MHKCPSCGGTLTPAEEGYSDEYVCNRCGEIVSEAELQIVDGEDEIFNNI